MPLTAMKKVTAAALASALLLTSAIPSHTLRADPTQSTMGGSGPLKDEITTDLRNRTKKGLDWLKKNLSKDGTIASSGGEQAGIMALVGLAFMADGNMPGEGVYGNEVEKILEFVLKSCQSSGLIASPGGGSPMYGHGFATLFLAEAYGMTQRQDVKEKLQLAVRLIVQSQNKEGGWRYQPVPVDADLSVTICQIMALRAARNAGIKVPKKTIDNAIDYVKKCQESDGGFSYMLQGRGSGFPRSAAGLACLFYAGIYEGKEIERGVKYLTSQLEASKGGNDYHFYYGYYYLTQAMFMAGGSTWEKNWPKIRAELIRRQTADGSWSGEAGNVYATAMALIALEVPNRLLPILQK
jgi:squalene cyclase